MLSDAVKGYSLSAFRLVVGFLFLSHGASSLFGLLGRPAPATGAWPGWWAALIQLVCGALVFLGLGTRFAALLASGSMAYAYFTVHQGQALLPIQNGGEAAAMFAWAFLLVAALGGGPLALDAVLRRVRITTGERASSVSP